MKDSDFVAALVLGCFALDAAEAEKVTYYVQLVRGTEDASPPSSDSKPIGPKIAKRLSPVFRWNHYWEMARKDVAVKRGEKKLVQLAPQRSVEIDLTNLAKRQVTAFEGKKPVYKVVNPIGSDMTVIGGDRSTNGSWFIIVRRDKPA